MRRFIKRLKATKDTQGLINAGARREWRGQIQSWMQEHPFEYEHLDNEIKPQYLMEKIAETSGGEAIISVDVGQHQMWAAQYMKFNGPRQWINSGGLGAMGFGLPA